ncbi:MAG: sirohydrochlorin chelatase [Cyanobacteria bacterium J06632_3]
MKPVAASTAYLLISHGSRDPRPQAAMERLSGMLRSYLEDSLKTASAVSERSDSDRKVELTCANSGLPGTSKRAGGTSVLARPRSQRQEEKQEQPSESVAPLPQQVIVGTACLELATLPLCEQIYEFAQSLILSGVHELKLLPVFLLRGVHVMEDIPEEIEKARKLIGNSLKLTVCPHLGSHPRIGEVLAQRLATVPAEGSLLVAHGSRRPKGNLVVQGLAKRLNTAVAYWSTPPDIETQAIALMQQGCQKLTILPYFLFAGGITDAIAHRTEELAERFPKIQFRLLPTLGATQEVAKLALDLIH